uniref:EF-hand domain-containing protein n=1 Tax=Alexandrium catenella TaxID=2925 RepID=A0A7S1WUU7_ALECA
MADGGARAHKVAKIKEAFRKYDKDGDGTITKQELCVVLRSLGSFKDAEINAVFSVIDANRDGRVQFNEFVDWVSGTDTGGYRARAALAPSSGDDIELSFAMFCEASLADMDCRAFSKMCKDVGFVDKGLTLVETDLIFSKVLAKGKRRIIFSQFQAALQLVAERKGWALAKVHQCIIDATRPTFHGTHPDSVRFHDDKSTYTGVRRATEGLAPVLQGRKSEPAALPSAVQTSKPYSRGAQRNTIAATHPGSELEPDSARSTSVGTTHILPPVTLCGSHTYKEVFRAFCGNQADLDAKGFAKLCRDCRLLDERFVAADADLLFSKVLERGQRRMHVSQFEEALYAIAERRGVEYSRILEAVASSGGPTMRATVAETPRLLCAERPGGATGATSPRRTSSSSGKVSQVPHIPQLAAAGPKLS